MRALIFFAAVCLYAQDEISPAGRGGGRGGRGNEFLGLGAPPDAAAAAHGESFTPRICSFCHGEKARGAEGPNLVRSTLVLHDEKGELIGPVVSKGRADKGMPAFSNFTEAQLVLYRSIPAHVSGPGRQSQYIQTPQRSHWKCRRRRSLRQRQGRLQELPIAHRRPGEDRHEVHT